MIKSDAPDCIALPMILTKMNKEEILISLGNSKKTKENNLHSFKESFKFKFEILVIFFYATCTVFALTKIHNFKTEL